MKRENIFWGLFFLCAGVFLIIGKLGFLPDINFFTLACTVLLVAWLIRGVRRVSFGEILFPVAFLCILYDDILGIESLTPWPVLGAAAFFTIGLSIIFKDRFPRGYETYVHRSCSEESTAEDILDDNFRFGNTFASSVKYVKSDNFTNAQISCSFGEIKVYFDDAIIQNGNATLQLDVKFGNAQLFIPKTWNVINHATAVFGAIEEKNRNCSTGSPTLTLVGDIAFGATEIFYC